jgi:hypothetical protein
MTEDEKELRDIYFSKYPEASEVDWINWLMDVYSKDEEWGQSVQIEGTFSNLRDYLEELE